MKKTVVKTAAPEPKDETQGSLNYRKELQDIKVLLEKISLQLSRMTGG